MKLAIIVFVTVAFSGFCEVGMAQVGEKKEGSKISEPVEHDERVKTLLDSSDLEFDIDEDGDFKFQFEYDDGRSHVVFVNSDTQTFQGMEIREVWAVGWAPEEGSTKVPSKIAQNLIRANSELKLGAWQVQTLSGREVAVFRAMIPAETDMETLRNTLQLVGVSADEKEMELTKKDEL